MHHDKTIYIIGCSPNLVANDLLVIANDRNAITIGVNYSFLSNIPTNYHIWMDWGFGSWNKTLLKMMANMGTVLFIPVDHQLQVSDHSLPGIKYYCDRNVDFVTRYDDEGLLRLGGSSTVIYNAIQIAVIMGSKKIVLLGVDFEVKVNNAGLGRAHFYDAENKLSPEVIYNLREKKRIFYDDLNKKALPYLNKHGIQLIDGRGEPNERIS